MKVRRVHAGSYRSACGGWRFRSRRSERRGGWWLESADGRRKEAHASLSSARLRAQALADLAEAKRRPSLRPDVERLTLRQVTEHADHWQAVDDLGRVLSTGPLALVRAAVERHWPGALA